MQRVVFKTVGMPWEDLAVARVVGLGERSGLRLIEPVLESVRNRHWGCGGQENIWGRG